MSEITVLVTNYEKKIFRQETQLKVEMEVGKNDLMLISGTIIHVWDTVPYMRNIPDNKQWFTSYIYHFN